MKLWLTSDHVDWDTGRYHYAAEQMMLTLFPLEKPQYPDTPAPTRPTAEDNAVIFTLRRGKRWASMSALLLREGRRSRGRVRFPGEKLEEPPEQLYHTLQRAVKESFYRAGAALLGHDLPWGSLTGVRPTKLPTRALWAGATPAQARRELEGTYHVSPLRAALAVDCARESVKVKKDLKPDQVALYIGIPFCPSRCVYCSFISAAVEQCLPLVDPFVDALCQEIRAVGRRLRATGTSVSSIYVGGGTPTTLSAPQMDRFLQVLTQNVPVLPHTEFTVEAGRPDTITPEKLSVCKAYGVGRVSVNPQSMDNTVLRRMGRPHTGEDILKAYEMVRAAGDFAVNMDLIAGLPGDSPEGFARSLETIVALSPENITVHTLALKKGSTLLTGWLDGTSSAPTVPGAGQAAPGAGQAAPGPSAGAALPSAAQVEEMLDAAWDTLRRSGYRPYYLYRQKYMSGSFENVGWARPGFESRYNIVMMEELQTVVALGGGGVTKLVDPAAGKVERLANPKYPQEYLRDRDKICLEKENLVWPIN